MQKSIYTAADDFIVDGSQMLDAGKLIDIRPHTRFVHFPRHKHNYIEIIYMCSGTTTHIINDTTKVTLDTGDLLFLNQNATQEILPAGKEDIACKFYCASRVFDRTFLMIDEQKCPAGISGGSPEKEPQLLRITCISMSVRSCRYRTWWKISSGLWFTASLTAGTSTRLPWGFCLSSF